MALRTCKPISKEQIGDTWAPTPLNFARKPRFDHFIQIVHNTTENCVGQT